MAGSYRRVVTGLSPEGRSGILSDETVGMTIVDDRGSGACRLWAADTVPAKRDTAIQDAGGPFPFANLVPANGVSFCLFEYPPEGSGASRDLLPDSDMMGYVVVVSGTITYLTEDQEVTLSAGDTIISRGVAHNLVNRGDVPAILAATIMNARSN